MTIPQSPLTFETLEAILRGLGWEPRRYDERRAVWSNGDKGVFIPHRVGSDFIPLIERSVEEIQPYMPEGDDLRWHLEWPTWDRFQSRIAGADYLPLRDVVRRQQALLEIVEATAWAAVNPEKAYFGGGAKPAIVREYVDSARAIPAAKGSFVLRTLLPLRAQAQIVAGDDQDFRTFTQSIPAAVEHAIAAASDVATGASDERWLHAHGEHGVTGNVLDALARHIGPEGTETQESGPAVELSMSFSVSQKQLAGLENQKTTVSIPTMLAPVLDVGRLVLKGEPEEQEIRLVGLVTKLERRSEVGAGHLTVLGEVEKWDLKERSIRFEADASTYDEALALHGHGRKVEVRLLVKRERTRVRVLRMTDFGPFVKP